MTKNVETTSLDLGENLHTFVLLSFRDKVHQSDTNTAISGGLFMFRKTGPYPTRCSTTTCLCAAFRSYNRFPFLFPLYYSKCPAHKEIPPTTTLKCGRWRSSSRAWKLLEGELDNHFFCDHVVLTPMLFYYRNGTSMISLIIRKWNGLGREGVDRINSRSSRI